MKNYEPRSSTAIKVMFKSSCKANTVRRYLKIKIINPLKWRLWGAIMVIEEKEKNLESASERWQNSITKQDERKTKTKIKNWNLVLLFYANVNYLLHNLMKSGTRTWNTIFCVLTHIGYYISRITTRKGKRTKKKKGEVLKIKKEDFTPPSRKED